MKIRLMHRFNDRQLKAISRTAGLQKPRKATRTECVQFVVQAVDRAIGMEIQALDQFEVNPDPTQMMLLPLDIPASRSLSPTSIYPELIHG